MREQCQAGRYSKCGDLLWCWCLMRNDGTSGDRIGRLSRPAIRSYLLHVTLKAFKDFIQLEAAIDD